MKNGILVALTVVLMTGTALLFESCGKSQPSAPPNSEVGLVFDVGGRGDKSFNDQAYRGLQMAKDSLGIKYQYIEPGGGSDRESALRQLASRKSIGLIFGVGFIFTDDITDVAKAFPDKKFACIDYTYDSTKAVPKNLIPIEFRENEGSFLVGAIAGLMTKTDKVGFVGGMESPLIRKFQAGYEAGVKYVNPKCKVLVAYAGVTGEAFKNPAKGKELALSQYSQGADIIYHAAGVTGLGVFEAAREMKKYAIGVDMDQWNEAPGRVLTSMVKKGDVAVYDIIKEWKEGKFDGGTPRVFGLRDNGVDFVYDNNNKPLIPEKVYQRVEQLRKDIIDGKIKVPTQ
ncbi:MAG: BMP family ABC transporter substrate-binding protein [Bacteroidetes bacterium]|jgi:basic membrane protein A|nr:BMP family ABC transporter substrate-binding protein [Bacteroidota bacterium]